MDSKSLWVELRYLSPPRFWSGGVPPAAAVSAESWLLMKRDVLVFVL